MNPFDANHIFYFNLPLCCMCDTVYLNVVLTLVWWGGGWFYPAFLRIIFTAKTKHFQGCLRVWSRENQARGHSCKLAKLAIFCHEKKYIFLLFLKLKREWIESSPPPPSSKLRVKDTPSKVRLILPQWLTRTIKNVNSLILLSTISASDVGTAGWARFAKIIYLALFKFKHYRTL